MDRPEDEQPPADYEDFLSSGVGRWIALLAVLLVIGGALWALPRLFVDEGAFIIDDDKTDLAGIQAAYNSARVPIGVILASLTAGAAAVLGVRATLKSLRTTELSLYDARQRHSLDMAASETRAEEAEARHKADLAASETRAEEAERRWVAETRSKRYMEASEQLGHEKGAVRLAGVYAMSRLADDWAEQRQVCIDVLCGYLRLPRERPGVHDDAQEVVVRRAIIHQIEAHITTDESRPPATPWWEMNFMFTGAHLPELRLRGVRVQSLGLSECHIDEGLTLANFQATKALSLRKARATSRVFIDVQSEVVNVGSIELLDGGSMELTHRSMADKNDGRQRVLAAGVAVGAGSSVTFTILPQHGRNYFDVRELRVHETGKARFVTAKDPQGNPLPGEFRSEVACLTRAWLPSKRSLHVDGELKRSVRFRPSDNRATRPARPSRRPQPQQDANSN